jgi:hypothetical protein
MKQYICLIIEDSRKNILGQSIYNLIQTYKNAHLNLYKFMAFYLR